MAANIQQTLLNAPLPLLIERLGMAIANAQFAMDHNGIEIARMMGDPENYGVQIGGPESAPKSMLELGFTPSFYQLQHATVEARVAFSMSRSTESSIAASVSAGVNVGFVAVAASVDASYSSKYSYEASGSSSISARFVAVPPPSALSDYLQSRRSAPDEPVDN